ncbi:MAG TPA: dTMP kinase [Fodinibius sp.]|nr:dTMP kinase [Fodinibius sp.]
MFITFEGIDGSGKSTQITCLREHLESKGIKVEVFRDPGGTDVSEEVRKLLLSPDYTVDAVTELLLFSSARSQLVAEKVLPTLEDGSVVMLDRFYDSTTAYQGYGRGSVELDHIHKLNNIASHGRAPDLTIYMKVSLEEAKERMAQKEKDRIEQAGDDFFRKVVAGFDELARLHERFFTVDATLPQEQVSRLIWDQVEELFGH